MSLNIKNEETHRMARELARFTGESMSTAVNEAVRERLERIRGNARKGMAEHLMEIGKDCAAHLKEAYKSMEIDELLYDESGVPK